MAKVQSLNIKGKYQILGIMQAHGLGQRLIELGFIEGSIIEVIGRGPLRGPFLVKIGNSFFALREEELASLKINPIN